MPAFLGALKKVFPISCAMLKDDLFPKILLAVSQLPPFMAAFFSRTNRYDNDPVTSISQ
jgi:hypothetical protein